MCVEQVLTMIVSEYVLLEMPERFWLWYSVMVPVLLGMRYPAYVQRKWHFFYLDFCYYVQVIVCTWLLLVFKFIQSTRTKRVCRIMTRCALEPCYVYLVLLGFFFPFIYQYHNVLLNEYLIFGNE